MIDIVDGVTFDALQAMTKVALHKALQAIFENPMQDAFVCDAQRTPFGRYGGATTQVAHSFPLLKRKKTAEAGS